MVLIEEMRIVEEKNSKKIAHMHFEYKRRTVDEVTLYFRDGYKDVKL